MSVQLHAEVRHAEESARVLDLMGRALVNAELRELAESIAEEAQERAAIIGAEQGGAELGGLVPVLTSGPERAAGRVAARSQALQRRKRAVCEDERKARIARMRRGVGFTARCHQAGAARPGHRPDYVAMLTLTYRGGVEAWAPRHVSDALQRIRKWLWRRQFSMRYAWVAELQKRGVIHYHVALWLPAGVVIPKADRRGWWPHGASNIKAAQKPVAYLMKYLSKGQDFGEFPAGARTFGVGGLEFAARRARRWLGLPSFIQARADCLDDWRRCKGGGWVDADGVLWESEYVRAWVGDRYGCLRLGDHGRPFPVDGPYMRLDRRAEFVQ